MWCPHKFCYHGQITVDQEELTKFLSIAKEHKLKELDEIDVTAAKSKNNALSHNYKIHKTEIPLLNGTCELNMKDKKSENLSPNLGNGILNLEKKCDEGKT